MLYYYHNLILEHSRKSISMVFLLITLCSACGQVKDKGDSTISNPFTLMYAIDPYRQNVKDSLKPLIPILDSIIESDQKYRYGTANNPNGKEAQIKAVERFNLHKKEISYLDSINVHKICAILDKYGWLGKKDIGSLESNAFFYVIQHADSATQEKYIPMLRQAVISKVESPQHLAMMEDRVILRKTKSQQYGTQLFYYSPKKRYYLFPLMDPDNIIKRRAEIGLDSLSFINYLKIFHLEWDITKYKSELPDTKLYLNAIKTHSTN